MCLLMTEFDCPELTLCGWQDVKIQFLANFCNPGDHFHTFINSLSCTVTKGAELELFYFLLSQMHLFCWFLREKGEWRE